MCISFPSPSVCATSSCLTTSLEPDPEGLFVSQQYYMKLRKLIFTELLGLCSRIKWFNSWPINRGWYLFELLSESGRILQVAAKVTRKCPMFLQPHFQKVPIFCKYLIKTIFTYFANVVVWETHKEKFLKSNRNSSAAPFSLTRVFNIISLIMFLLSVCAERRYNLGWHQTSYFTTAGYWTTAPSWCRLSVRCSQIVDLSQSAANFSFCAEKGSMQLISLL